MKINRQWLMLSIVVLSGIYLFLRLYKFEERTTYHLDQGLHLLESWEMVNNKDWRLVGPMVSSKTFFDRGFFIGPQYYYVLAGLGLVTNWDPISIDLILLLIDLGIILYFVFWMRKKYGEVEALTSLGLLTFSRYFIIHSRFFWNPHFLLPLGILAVISLINYAETSKIKYLWFLGIFWGLAFGFHYAGIFWGLPILTVLLVKKKFFKKETFLILPIGFMLGNLPWWVFELRNNFYNLKTIWWVMTQSKNSGRMEPHYFIYPLGVFVLTALGWCLSKISNKRKKVGLAAGLFLAVSYFQVITIKDAIPLGHPEGWNYLMAKEVTNRILKDGCPKDFNIATTISGDTRAYDLRFLLIREGCRPMEVDKYPETKILFLVAPENRRPEGETVWEVSSLGKFKVKREEMLSNSIIFYELEKL